jgi:hypothetical protein
MTQAVANSDRGYGELIDLAAELVEALQVMKNELLLTGALQADEQVKQLSHAINLATRLQRKTKAIVKANSCRS